MGKPEPGVSRGAVETDAMTSILLTNKPTGHLSSEFSFENAQSPSTSIASIYCEALEGW